MHISPSLVDHILTTLVIGYLFNFISNYLYSTLWRRNVGPSLNRANNWIDLESPLVLRIAHVIRSIALVLYI